MPVTSAITTPLFLANLASSALVGISTPQLALAVATGFEIYCGSGLMVNSIDVGTLGAGAGLGVGMILAPPALIGSFTSTFAASGLLGIMAPSLIIALATSFSLVLAQAEVITVSAGVGVGTGVSSLIPNPASSLAAYTAGFAAAGLVGLSSIQLITAISLGFDTVAPTALGVVVIAGPPSILPGAGKGTGILL